MIHLNKLVTVDVMLTCEVCKTWVTSKVRLRDNMRLDFSDFPPGWIVSTHLDYFKAYCPEHGMNAK